MAEEMLALLSASGGDLVDKKQEVGHEESEAESAETKVIAGGVLPYMPYEADVGITEYVNSSNLGFKAIIKHRQEVHPFFLCSDFIVNEIDLNRNVVHLKSLSDIKDPYLEELRGDDDEDIAKWESDRLVARAQELLEPIIGGEYAQKVFEMASAEPSSDKINCKLIIEMDIDKKKRTKLYSIVNKYLKNRVYGQTVNGRVELSIYSEGDDPRGGQAGHSQRKRREWNHGGNYCHFTLYKENKNTMDVLNFMAKALKVKTSVFGFAGTKDKRAITFQRCSAFKIEASRLSGAIARMGGGKSVKIGDFVYEKEQLKLGDLLGNHFTVVLRYVEGATQEEIESAIMRLRERGFINYFGMQRFGNSSVSSHIIGRAVIRQDWKEAVDLILNPQVGEREDIQKAREAWKETRDPKEVLKLMPRFGVLVEKAILNFFVKNNVTNYAGAFIPYMLRRMYVHSYQSYVWNHAASERARRYGVDRAVPGDLVIVSDARAARKRGKTTGDEEEDDEGEAADIDVGRSGRGKLEVAIVTEDTAYKYSVTDVVLPILGWDVKMPTNSIADVYIDMMAKDGISIDTYRNHGLRQYRPAGTYRKFIAKPEDLE
ncbi:multisubstrate pseudouridine synthase 7, partial [Spiromyces aspiralis]